MMTPIEGLKERFSHIEGILGYSFKNKDYLLLPLIHRSFVNEHRELQSEHNERLEFLGDSVLGLIVSNFLYHYLPEEPEGELSSLRSQIVDAPSCARFVTLLGLEEFLLLGRGESRNTGRGRMTLLADLFEALLGAIYLDGGIAEAESFFLKHFKAEMLNLIKNPNSNWKAKLQDYSQKRYQKPPVYQIVKTEGPDHAKTFTVEVEINGVGIGIGEGASKKEAEQMAAQKALESLGDVDE